MKFINYIAIISILFAMQSCATIISGTNQTVMITSNPQGADIYINNKDIHKKTPAEVNINKKVRPGQYNIRNQYNYTLKHEGYQDMVISDFATTNGLVWLNLLFIYAAPIAIPIDFISGGANKYNKNIYANLVVKKDNTDIIVKDKIVYIPTGLGPSQYVFKKNSDIDKNIPISHIKNENVFALIIGNEDYSSFQLDLSNEVNVDYARNDASAFKEYAINLMGIPEENIIFMLDATTGKMNQGIAKANRILKATNGKAEMFVYYAGHGLPDENTKERDIE